MYYEGSYFWQLFHDTQVYTRRATSIYCGPPASTRESLHTQLAHHTQRAPQSQPMSKRMPNKGRRDVTGSFSVEVGCGTGDVILSLASDFKHSLGI
ncbi:unnamed protein product, partial [Ectocarpus sp. 8 AP-2014]